MGAMPGDDTRIHPRLAGPWEGGSSALLILKVRSSSI